jgi:hypothetical protein
MGGQVVDHSGRCEFTLSNASSRRRLCSALKNPPTVSHGRSHRPILEYGISAWMSEKTGGGEVVEVKITKRTLMVFPFFVKTAHDPAETRATDGTVS